MSTNQKIAPHESFELHELLTFKNICATKSLTMGKLVTDPELKTLLENDYTLSYNQIDELRNLLKLSSHSSETKTNTVH